MRYVWKRKNVCLLFFFLHKIWNFKYHNQKISDFLTQWSHSNWLQFSGLIQKFWFDDSTIFMFIVLDWHLAIKSIRLGRLKHDHYKNNKYEKVILDQFDLFGQTPLVTIDRQMDRPSHSPLMIRDCIQKSSHHPNFKKFLCPWLPLPS